MKHELSKLKKTAESETHATFSHPEGHHLVIDKSKLSRDHLNALKKLPIVRMADGGDVPNEMNPADFTSPEQYAAALEAANPGVSHGDALGSYYAPRADAQDPTQQFAKKGDTSFADARARQEEANRSPAGIVDDAKKWWEDTKAHFNDVRSPEHAQMLANQGPYKTVQAAPSAPVQQARQATSENFPLVAPNAARSPTAFVPQLPPMHTISDNSGAISNKADAALQGYSQASNDYSNQLQKSAGEQASLYQKQARELQDTQVQTQKTFDSIAAQSQQLLKDYQNGHIDPNHYWDQKTTGGKIAGAIGLILGGIGGGLTHQENPALKFLNDLADRDVKSQMANMDKQKNLFTANMEMLGDSRAAALATKANILDRQALELKSALAGASGQTAQAAGKMALFQIQNEAYKTQLEAAKIHVEAQKENNAQRNAYAQLQAQQNAQSALLRDPNNVSVQILAKVPPKARDGAVKELKEYQDHTAKTKNVLDSFDTVMKTKQLSYAAKNPLRWLSGAESNQLNQALAEVAHDTTGRFNENEYKQLQQQFLPKFTDTEDDLETKRKGLEKFMDQKGHFPTLDLYGITHPKQKSYNRIKK